MIASGSRSLAAISVCVWMIARSWSAMRSLPMLVNRQEAALDLVLGTCSARPVTPTRTGGSHVRKGCALGGGQRRGDERERGADPRRCGVGAAGGGAGEEALDPARPRGR